MARAQNKLSVAENGNQPSSAKVALRRSSRPTTSSDPALNQLHVLLTPSIPRLLLPNRLDSRRRQRQRFLRPLLLRRRRSTTSLQRKRSRTPILPPLARVARP